MSLPSNISGTETFRSSSGGWRTNYVLPFINYQCIEFWWTLSFHCRWLGIKEVKTHMINKIRLYNNLFVSKILCILPCSFCFIVENSDRLELGFFVNLRVFWLLPFTQWHLRHGTWDMSWERMCNRWRCEVVSNC